MAATYSGNGAKVDRDTREEARADLQRGRAELRSIGSRGAEIAEDLRELGRLEAELAKAEVAEQRKLLMQGTIAAAAAALVGFWVLGLLGAAMTLALMLVWDGWLAALVTAGTFLAVAAIAGFLARTRFKQFSPTPHRTIASVKEDIAWLRELMKQNARSVNRGA